MIIHEPVTLLTDYLLTLLGGGLAWRLWRDTAMSIAAVRWWFRALLVLALSALVGGSYHGFAPNFPGIVDEIWWRLVLWTICLLGYTMGAALVCEFSSSSGRVFLKRLLVTKLVLSSTIVLILPDFFVAIIDYGSAMLAWLVGALMVRRTWRGWIIVAVLLSMAAAWVQQNGAQWAGVLNHNDLFHLIQALALVAFYRAALRMGGTEVRSLFGWAA